MIFHHFEFVNSLLNDILLKRRANSPRYKLNISASGSSAERELVRMGTANTTKQKRRIFPIKSTSLTFNALIANSVLLNGFRSLGMCAFY